MADGTLWAYILYRLNFVLFNDQAFVAYYLIAKSYYGSRLSEAKKKKLGKFSTW